MLETIIDFDQQIFLLINSKHVEWLDPLMLALSSYVLWAIVFVALAIIIYVSSKDNKISGVLFYLASVVFSTVFTNGLKFVVQRPRPIHVERWQGTIHAIEKYSNSYSFFSSHAATTFCIATFFGLFFLKNKLYGFLALLWAFGVSYSRIYVAKHYPGDVLVGTLFGIFVGYLSYRLYERYVRKHEPLSA